MQIIYAFCVLEVCQNERQLCRNIACHMEKHLWVTFHMEEIPPYSYGNTLADFVNQVPDAVISTRVIEFSRKTTI